MIVTDLPDGRLEITRQVDHAHLSAAIARSWRQPVFFDDDLWAQFILAVKHHDDGWAVADDDPVLDTQGRPISFRDSPTYRHVAIWQRTLDMAYAWGVYPQLLIALHARWLYTHLPSADAHGQDGAVYMIEQLDRLIASSLKTLADDGRYAQVIEPRHLELSQKLFSFFDALSLVFLRGIDWISRTDALPVGESVESIRLLEECCNIRWGRAQPWPFVEDDVSFPCPVRRVAGQPYKDGHDLHDVLVATPAYTCHWSLGRL